MVPLKGFGFRGGGLRHRYEGFRSLGFRVSLGFQHESAGVTPGLTTGFWVWALGSRFAGKKTEL